MTPALRAAVHDLDEHLIEARSWLSAVNAPENPPAWAFAVSRLLDRIDGASHELQLLLNREGATL